MQRKDLEFELDIKAALKKGPVFCRLPELDPARLFVVRDVRRHKVEGVMRVQVLVLEGWHCSPEIWTHAAAEELAA